MECTIKIELTRLDGGMKKELDQFRLEGNTLVKEVKNDDYAATRLVMELRKRLQELGRKHRFGIKDISLHEYRVCFDLDKEPLKEIAVPFGKLAVDGKKAELFYQELGFDAVKNHYVEREMALVKEKAERHHYEGKAETHVIVREAKRREPAWDRDPTDEMLKAGWITRGPTKGKWVYMPPFTALARAMEQIIIEEFIRPMGFQEVMATNVINEDIWLKTGHLAGMPMEIYYVREPLTRNPEAWELVIDEIKVTRKVPHQRFNAMLKDAPVYGLTYAQCPVIYWGLRNKVFKELPVLIFDRTQNSFRYEAGGRHGLERVDEFHRIEPIFIATPEQCLELRKKMMALYERIFDHILELEWRAANVTPFFLQHAGKEHEEQAKEIGTIDFEAWLPYRGGRDKEWLEFQNLTVVGDKYAKAFNLKARKGEVWTGCTGICLERWAVAFLAQKGMDPRKWPAGFREYMDEVPKTIEGY